MIILDPDRDGCTVWLIHSPIIGYESKVTHIKGNTLEVCKSLINRLTVCKKVKSQWGIYVKKCWVDCVYLDIAAFGRDYKYILRDNGLEVIDISYKSADSIIPEGSINMKTIDGFERFEEDFYAIPGTMFVENMRDATPDEQKSIQENTDKISKPTGINFYD